MFNCIISRKNIKSLEDKKDNDEGKNQPEDAVIIT